jgi:hypothetical protein
MEEANGDRKQYRATIPVAVHFFLFGQFLGFSGSFGPSKVTRFSSIAASSGISSYLMSTLERYDVHFHRILNELQ